MTTTAVILAAGRGSRLAEGGERESYSKPLIVVGGQTLLERAVSGLRGAGIERIVVVTGFRADLVSAEVERINRGDLETVYNEEWQKSMGISVYVCRKVIDGDFLLTMADHVFEPSILEDLLAQELPADSVMLAVDHKIDSIFDLGDATKVRIEDGVIVGIGKTLEVYDAADCGLFYCTTALFDALGEVYDDCGDCSLSDGNRVLARRGVFFPFDIGARWWQDIDTPEMLGEAIERLSLLGS